MSPADRVALLRTRDVPTQVVGYSDEELQERALAEALAAARALGRAWRRRAPRAARLALLEALGAPVPPTRSIVEALLKHTLAGGFRIVERRDLVGPGGFYARWSEIYHEPFELSRPPTRLRPGGP